MKKTLQEWQRALLHRLQECGVDVDSATLLCDGCTEIREVGMTVGNGAFVLVWGTRVVPNQEAREHFLALTCRRDEIVYLGLHRTSSGDAISTTWECCVYNEHIARYPTLKAFSEPGVRTSDKDEALRWASDIANIFLMQHA